MTLNIQTLRYQFSKDFMEELHVFSKIHQFDDRHEFKDAWKIWVEDNDELVKTEVEGHVNAGYKGDVLDKMFKSARYYFKKKQQSPRVQDEESRKEYVKVSEEFIEAIDKHIQECLTNMEKFTPKMGFKMFCNTYIKLLENEVKLISKHYSNNVKLIEEKIKKTYKNRYSVIVRKR